MISQREKYDALNKVQGSSAFSKAIKANVLLKFLVESTIQQKELSTITIGLELFGNRYDSETSDVNIRVSISHLRKRLEQYYADEGQNDPVIITIEPGQYNVTFTERGEAQKSKSGRKLIIATTFLLVAVWSVILLNKRNDRVWSPMFKNKLETILYLGDVFGYSGPTAFGNNGWHRDSHINSAEEFFSLKQKNPLKYKRLQPGEYSYMVFENSYNIKPFTKYFTQNSYDFLIRPTTDFKIRSVKDQNTIYAGPLYVQKVFNDLFNDFANNVELFMDTLQGTSPLLKYKVDGEIEIININSRYPEGEYALASAFNGPNNTRHYIFFSNHGMGLTAVVENFTNPKSLHEFSKKYLNESNEFIALFFVKGKDRTSLSMELVFVDDNCLD